MTEHFANRRADDATSLDAALAKLRDLGAMLREAETMARAVRDGRAEARALARLFLARVEAADRIAIEEPPRMVRGWREEQKARMG